MAIQIERKLFTVSDYARMRESGILTEDDRVELIGGEVRSMTPIGPQHAAILKRLIILLTHQLEDAAIMGVQDPIQLNDYSEPQPDISILRPRDDFYASAHPQPTDVLIVIEVSDTSADYDRNEKITRYGEASIPEAWLIDIANQVIEQYTLPRQRGYQNRRLLENGDSVVSPTMPAIQLLVSQIFVG